MKPVSFVFINSVTRENITDFEDILLNERLKKYLWIELILNPQLTAIAASYIEKNAVRESLSDALSWYIAFRWLFQSNKPLEKLHAENVLVPHKIKHNIFRLHKRNFLKGIMHARLC